MFISEQISELKKNIKSSYGLSLDNQRVFDLESALKERMTLTKISSINDYLELVLSRQGEKELEELVSLLSIGETGFFRTPQQFWALRDFVFPELLKTKRCRDDKKIRMLSAGCATGEEAWTLAIMALESIPEQENFEIEVVGCDLNKKFIEVARGGKYPHKRLKNVDKEFKDKYFDQREGYFYVKSQLKPLVRFIRFNLGNDDYARLSPEEGFDLIFCRNVLIYFDQVALPSILKNFHKILNNPGYLFLGYSESLYGLDSKFSSVYVPGTFYYKKLPAGEQREKGIKAKVKKSAKPWDKFEPHFSLVREQEGPDKLRDKKPLEQVKIEEQVLSEGELWDKAIEWFEQEDFKKAKVYFEKMTRSSVYAGLGYTGLALIFGNLGEQEKAENYLEKAFKEDSFIAEAYYLSGLLAERKENLESAIESYRRAIFLKSDFVMAHFNLGNLYLRLSDLENARREFKVVYSLLKAGMEKVYLSTGWSGESLKSWVKLHLDSVERKTRDYAFRK